MILEISDNIEQDNQENSRIRPEDDLGSESSSDESSSDEEFNFCLKKEVPLLNICLFFVVSHDTTKAR